MKRTIMIICLAATMILLFVGCQANNNESVDETNKVNNVVNEKEEVKEEVKEEATLRFSWWGSEGRHKALLEAIKVYMDKNPHITIEAEYGGFDGYYQKLVTQFAGGTAPDLTPLSVDWIDEISVKRDLVYDLNELKEYINIGAFDADFLSRYAVFENKLVGLPMGVNGMTIAYNKQFFERFNIPEDTKWDWETIHSVGKRVHEEDPKAYLLGLLDYRGFLQPYVNQITGNQWVNNDHSLGFDAATAGEAFAYYKKLLDDGVLQPVEESALYPDVSENPQWINGDIGMTFTLASTVTRFKASIADLAVSMFPVPADAKTSAILVNPSNPLAINKASEHPEEAAKFASWLLTDIEAAAILGDIYSVPAVKASMDSVVEKQLIDTTVAEAVELALQNPGNPVNGISGNNELAQLTKDYMEKVAFGKITPEQAGQELVDRTIDKLKTLK